MGIKHWPEDERPREKLLQKGPKSLSDAELLAIFLRTGVQGVSAVELARHLLAHFGGINALLAADLDRFTAAKGLGAAKYAQLQAVMELSRRYLQEQLVRDHVFTSPTAVKNYIQSHLGGRHQEVFAALFLDSQHRLIVCEELFFGTIDGAAVYPREVVKRALAHNAGAVIVAHNHPSGIAEPSQDDRRITDRLKQALDLVDVRLLDHLVVGAGSVVSMAEMGQM
jgi:DNA repair protein RadC